MTVKELKKQEIFKKARGVVFVDINGKDISYKPSIILDLLVVIGTSNMANGKIEVVVNYEE